MTVGKTVAWKVARTVPSLAVAKAVAKAERWGFELVRTQAASMAELTAASMAVKMAVMWVDSRVV